MSVHPRTTQDLTLAPAAIELDTRLHRYRDKTPTEIALELTLALNAENEVPDRDRRASLILEAVTKDADLRGWHASITDDASRVRLSGGSVTLDLGLSASILSYITEGASARAAG